MNTSSIVPYTLKLLYIASASFVKSPNIEAQGAIYVFKKNLKNSTEFIKIQAQFKIPT